MYPRYVNLPNACRDSNNGVMVCFRSVIRSWRWTTRALSPSLTTRQSTSLKQDATCWWRWGMLDACLTHAQWWMKQSGSAVRPLLRAMPPSTQARPPTPGSVLASILLSAPAAQGECNKQTQSLCDRSKNHSQWHWIRTKSTKKPNQSKIASSGIHHSLSSLQTW